MKGKVINVQRPEPLERTGAGPYLKGQHGINQPRTPYATLEDGKNVEIPEDMIRNLYNRERITENLIIQLKNDLVGKEIEYSNDEDGNGLIDGSLEQYIPNQQ